VQVNARGATGKPAFETTFTSVTFARPSASVFRFSPPPGAKVSELGSPPASGASALPDSDHATGPKTAGTPARGPAPRVIGTGWTSVLEVQGVTLPTSGSTSGAEGDRGSAGDVLGTFQRAMTPVHGGQAIQTALVSVLLTDDGRLLVGAVPKSVLVQAAGS
jgi:hypothetical protein